MESLLLNGFVPESDLGFNIRPSWYKNPAPDNEATKSWRRKINESNYMLVKHADFNNPSMIVVSVALHQTINDNIFMGFFGDSTRGREPIARALPVAYIKDIVPIPEKEFKARFPRKSENSASRIWRESDKEYYMRVIWPEMIKLGLEKEFTLRHGR